MKSFYIIFAIIAVVGVGWFMFNDSLNTETGQIKQDTSNVQDETMSLGEAQQAIGMECDGSNVSMECLWDGTEYDFLVPTDWENDRAKRTQACEQGYINEKYNMVTDGETWYATANFEKENTALVNAFKEIGFESTVASYCR